MSEEDLWEVAQGLRLAFSVLLRGPEVHVRSEGTA